MHYVGSVSIKNFIQYHIPLFLTANLANIIPPIVNNFRGTSEQLLGSLIVLVKVSESGGSLEDGVQSVAGIC